MTIIGTAPASISALKSPEFGEEDAAEDACRLLVFWCDAVGFAELREVLFVLGRD